MSFEGSNISDTEFEIEEDELDVPQNNTIDVFEIPIEDLIERRDRYINELKLEKAQEIDSIIDYIQSVAHTGPVQRVKDYLVEKFNEFFEQYNENCNEIKENSKDKEMEIRIEGDQCFVEMKARHIDQLLEIEKMRAYELIFIKNKPIKKAIGYEQQAKYSAHQKEYAKAYHFRQQADKERERVQAERRGVVEEKMSNLKSNLLATIRNEMKVLAEKIQDQIKSNQSSLNAELNVQLKTFKVQVNNEVQKAINGLNNYITKNETKRLLASEISSFSDAKIKEITGMEMNITVSPQVSPSHNQKSYSQTTSQAPSPSPAKRAQNSSTQSTQTTPKQNKQRKQQNSPKPANTSTPKNAPKPLKEQKQQQPETQKVEQQHQQQAAATEEILQEEEEEVSNLQENQQQQNEIAENQPQQQPQPQIQQQQQEQPVPNDQEIQNQINEITNLNDVANAGVNEANEDTDDFNIDSLINSANGENNANNITDPLLLNENSKNDDLGLNLDESGAGVGADAAVVSDQKSNTDEFLNNLLDGGSNNDDFLANLGEGNSSNKPNSDSFLNFGED